MAKKQPVELIVGHVECNAPVRLLDSQENRDCRRETSKQVMITNTDNGLVIHCANYRGGKCFYNGLVAAEGAPSCAYGGLQGVKVSTREARQYFKL